MGLINTVMGRKFGNLVIFAPNSSGMIDIYTLSHIVHGLLFYFVFSMFLPFHWVVAFSVVTECMWEIFENSSFCIARYRKTISVDYQGDTIINSVCDVIAMLIGVGLATLCPLWGIIAFILGLELIALVLIRDNLCLNIIMLVYPFDCIKEWQLRKQLKLQGW